MNRSSKTWDHWVVDATMGTRGGMFCCCPVELDADGNITSVVTGMNLIGVPPGKLIAVVHEDGNDAVEVFCAEHESGLRELFAANRRAHGEQ